MACLAPGFTACGASDETAVEANPGEKTAASALFVGEATLGTETSIAVVVGSTAEAATSEAAIEAAQARNAVHVVSGRVSFVQGRRLTPAPTPGTPRDLRRPGFADRVWRVRC